MGNCLSIEEAPRKTQQPQPNKPPHEDPHAQQQRPSNGYQGGANGHPQQPQPPQPRPSNPQPHAQSSGRTRAPVSIATYGYRKLQMVGQGAYGEVALVEDVNTHKRYAMKLIERGYKIDDTVRREIQTHRRIYHTHIIAFKEAFLLPEHLAIVMEYASGGDMFNYVTTRKYADGTRGRLKEAEARWYFQQLILAVDYLHKMGIASRDIKLENCLLVPSPQNPPEFQVLKLCDFGTVKDLATANANTLVGTLPYMAPEIVQATRGGYDPKKADMWSCGVWLYTVVVGAYSHGDAPDYRKPVRYPNWVQPTTELDDLIKRLLTVDSSQRATIEDIKTHPWFRKDFPDRAFQKNNPRKVADSNEETEQLDALLRAASRRSSTGPGHHRRESSSTSSYM